MTYILFLQAFNRLSSEFPICGVVREVHGGAYWRMCPGGDRKIPEKGASLQIQVVNFLFDGLELNVS